MEGEAAGLFGQFEAVVRELTLYLATGVEGVAGLVVGFAVLESLWRVLRLGFSRLGFSRLGRRSGTGDTESIRLHLGHWLAVALELLLAADILKTAVAPTWDDIGKLAAIAGIRTALNYFLDREVREEARHVAAEAASTPAQAAPPTRG